MRSRESCRDLRWCGPPGVFVFNPFRLLRLCFLTVHCDSGSRDCDLSCELRLLRVAELLPILGVIEPLELNDRVVGVKLENPPVLFLRLCGSIRLKPDACRSRLFRFRGRFLGTDLMGGRIGMGFTRMGVSSELSWLPSYTLRTLGWRNILSCRLRSPLLEVERLRLGILRERAVLETGMEVWDTFAVDSESFRRWVGRGLGLATVARTLR